ncbi:hypothetical protein [[Mycoplasma] testudinis]|uniref:hypothetical protein n=1 Tax=[Mycoplasma] testudinis TaxID=33924 RepID=UPI0004865A68|nr:hypothetical protein [[Mycoplasma] testudinis]
MKKTNNFFVKFFRKYNFMFLFYGNSFLRSKMGVASAVLFGPVLTLILMGSISFASNLLAPFLLSFTAIAMPFFY